MALELFILVVLVVLGAALLTIAGVGLTFGCWWMYFALPWAEPMVRHRARGFPFGYGHLLIFGALFIAIVLLLPGGLVQVAARVRSRRI